MPPSLHLPDIYRLIRGLRRDVDDLKMRGLSRSTLAIYPIKVCGDAEAVTVGDGKFSFVVTAADRIAGLRLLLLGGYVTTASTAGLPTVQIRRVRGTTPADMLTTKLTIDVLERSSDNALTAAVIDAANNDIALGDMICIDVDVAGASMGLGVVLVFG